MENFLLATTLNILRMHSAQSLVTTTLTQPIQHCAFLIQFRKFSLSTPWRRIAIGVQLLLFLTSAVAGSSQPQTQVALFPQKNARTLLIVGWLDSETCLVVLEKRKISFPLPGFETRTVKPVASLHTGYDISALPEPLQSSSNSLNLC